MKHKHEEHDSESDRLGTIERRQRTHRKMLWGAVGALILAIISGGGWLQFTGAMAHGRDVWNTPEAVLVVATNVGQLSDKEAKDISDLQQKLTETRQMVWQMRSEVHGMTNQQSRIVDLQEEILKAVRKNKP